MYQKGGLFTAQQTSTSTPAYRSEHVFLSCGTDDMRYSMQYLCMSKRKQTNRKRYFILIAGNHKSVNT